MTCVFTTFGSHYKSILPLLCMIPSLQTLIVSSIGCLHKLLGPTSEPSLRWAKYCHWQLTRMPSRFWKYCGRRTSQIDLEVIMLNDKRHPAEELYCTQGHQARLLQGYNDLSRA